MTPQKVSWQVEFTDGKILKEFEGDKETVFDSITEPKSSYKNVSLHVRESQEKICAFDLITGCLYLGDKKLGLHRDVFGRNMSFTNLPVKYNEGVIQYKCSKPVAMLQKFTEIQTFNVGYKINLESIPYFKSNDGSGWTHFQVLASVNNDTMDVSVSMQYTIRMTDGREIRI